MLHGVDYRHSASGEAPSCREGSSKGHAYTHGVSAWGSVRRQGRGQAKGRSRPDGKSLAVGRRGEGGQVGRTARVGGPADGRAERRDKSHRDHSGTVRLVTGPLRWASEQCTSTPQKTVKRRALAQRTDSLDSLPCEGSSTPDPHPSQGVALAPDDRALYLKQVDLAPRSYGFGATGGSWS